jgi:hypothetical protein
LRNGEAKRGLRVPENAYAVKATLDSEDQVVGELRRQIFAVVLVVVMGLRKGKGGVREP